MATRTEQYLNAIERAQNALVTGNLELAASYINAAQYVRHDLEMQGIYYTKMEFHTITE